MFKPSPYQVAVFDAIESCDPADRHLMVKAVAGSGKTTTIVNALERTQGDVLMLAFNKSIATELGKRVPRHAICKTFHSLGFSALCRGRRRGEITVDGRKNWHIMKGKVSGVDIGMSKSDISIYGGFVAKLVGLAKQAGIGALVPDDNPARWFALIDHHNMVLRQSTADPAVAVRFARRVLRAAGEVDTLIDFDDMLWMPLLKGCNFRKFDWVFVDEAQDTNPLQIAIVRQLMDSKTRLCFVGDPLQAIYGFRGADSSAMPNIALEFGCRELPLSVSHRCAANIVATAREFCPQIEAREGAESGAVLNVEAYDVATLDGAVICRNVAPLLGLAYLAIAAGRAVDFLGRDIGKGLDNLINRIAGTRTTSLDVFEARTKAWYARESAKAEEDDNKAAMDRLDDQYACLMVLIDNVPEGARTVAQLQASVAAVFEGGGANALQLCTIHKSKGMEWDTVNILDAWRMPSKYAIGTPWMEQQEDNLHYVAITRAKHVLRYISTVEE